jgi:VWFA-related protein
MKGFSQVGLLIICFLFFTTAFGQRATPSPKPQSTPPVEDNGVVKITTTLIQVDATVLDKKGNIVTGLTPDDFEIYENNKKQRITNFSFVELQPNTPKADAIAAKPDKHAIPVPPVPVRLRAGQVRRTVALVVDDLGLSFPSIDAVRSALKKFVDEQMQPGDLVAIIRTGSGAGALQQFTSDKRMLYAAIKRVSWNPKGRGELNIFQPLDPSDLGASLVDSQSKSSRQGIDEASESNRQFDDYREDIFAVGTLGAVNYVIKGMRELPGRKAVVLFSDGLGLYVSDKGIKKPNLRLIDNLQRLTELANRSSVIIYTLDARGVVNALVLDAQDNLEGFNQDPTSSSPNTTIENTITSRSAELFESQRGLKVLAEQTGGFASINNNNLSKGIERVLNDQRGYYLLGYQPDSETFDPKKARFHKLTVKLKRPELRIRYRSGFFGIRDEDVTPQIKSPRQQILAALTSPLNSGDIDLRLTSLFAHDVQTGAFMRSLVYVNGRDLKFTEDADGWQKATFDIVAMIFGDNGTIVDEVSRTETIKARADTLQEILDKGFVATVTVPIKKPGGYQMRVVMRDTATSRIGSANQFIEVPNLKKNQLALSGIVIERYDAKRPVEASSKRQFQSDEERDSATRLFHLGDAVKFDLSIYNAKTDQAANTNLVMQYKVYRDGKEIFATPEKPLNLSPGSNPRSIDRSGVFQIGRKMLPGDYVLQVIVRDLLAKGKGQLATQWTDFEVAP